jgi:hypothetical protein
MFAEVPKGHLMPAHVFHAAQDSAFLAENKKWLSRKIFNK